MVSYSEHLLSLSIARLTRLLEAFDDMTPGLSKDLGEEFRALRKAVEIAYHERAQLQKLRAQAGLDVAGGGTLDLDAARAEIGRRLDRLRATGPGGGVSGQP